VVLLLHPERRRVVRLVGFGREEVVPHDGVRLSPVHAPDPAVALVRRALRQVAHLAHVLGQCHVVLGHARVEQGEDLG